MRKDRDLLHHQWSPGHHQTHVISSLPRPPGPDGSQDRSQKLRPVSLFPLASWNRQEALSCPMSSQEPLEEPLRGCNYESHGYLDDVQSGLWVLQHWQLLINVHEANFIRVGTLAHQVDHLLQQACTWVERQGRVLRGATGPASQSAKLLLPEK